MEVVDINFTLFTVGNLHYQLVDKTKLHLFFCFCFSFEDCRTTLAQFGVQDITPAAVARVLGKILFTTLQFQHISRKAMCENLLEHLDQHSSLYFCHLYSSKQCN